MIPTGKVLFGWKPAYIAGGDIDATVDAAREMGLSGVSLKVGSGVFKYPWNDYDLLPLVTALKSAGIRVYGWHYVYGSNLPRYEAEIARQQIEYLELEAYEIDAEAHYKGYSNDQASELVERIKENGIPVGLTSYRYPDVHRELPWRGFLSEIDYYVPQVYWQPPPSTPTLELDKTILQWTRLVLSYGYSLKPFIPAGRVYIGDGYPTPGPPVSEITEFLDACKNGYKCPGATFWSFDNLYTHRGGEARADAIAAFDWETDPIDPPTDPTDAEKLDALWDHHPELH